LTKTSLLLSESTPSHRDAPCSLLHEVRPGFFESLLKSFYVVIGILILSVDFVTERLADSSEVGLVLLKQSNDRHVLALSV